MAGQLFEIHKRIWDAIQTARSNGYNFDTPVEWTGDLLLCSPEFEGWSYQELLDCVETILRDERVTRSIFGTP